MAAPAQAPSDVKYFATRRIPYGSRFVRVVLQDNNGPCPLIAVANLLSLRGDIDVPLVDGQQEQTSSAALSNVLADLALDRASKAPTEDSQQAVADVVAVLPHMVEGLDINIRFDGPESHEYTEDCAVFDALDMRLLHGWVAEESSDGPVARVLRKFSYNALMNVLSEIDAHNSPRDSAAVDSESGTDASMEGLPLTKGDALDRRAGQSQAFAAVKEHAAPIHEWLECTSGQLTATGLLQLCMLIKEGQLAVLFRSNHYSVVTTFVDPRSNAKVLVQLVTDVGVARAGHAWETVEDLDGGCTRFFKEIPGTARPRVVDAIPLDPDQPAPDAVPAHHRRRHQPPAPPRMRESAHSPVSEYPRRRRRDGCSGDCLGCIVA